MVRNKSNEELRIDLEDLTQRLRQHRIDRGLPPEPKRVKPFVSIPLSLILLERLQPFVQIAVKYTALLASGTVHRIDTAAFDKYREYAEVVGGSSGFWCRWAAGGVSSMIKLMERLNGATDEDIQIMEVVRKAHFIIEMMRHSTDQDVYDYTDGKAYDSLIAVRAEIERLKNDPAAFQAEYDAALEQRKQIGEDFAIE